MNFFAKENIIDDKELKEALKKMGKQIKSINGQFTFDFKIDGEGWVARCREFDGIITGGISNNPSQEEIMQSLIDAIKTAFHIPISKLKIQNNELHGLPKIKVVREFQLA